MTKNDRGACAYHNGAAAEDQVARLYEDGGHQVLHRRWRGAGGEIDLILQVADTIVFVEVKKSRDLMRAAERLCLRQLRRIYTAAEEFLGGQAHGLLTPARVDVALVDQPGRIHILENVYHA